MLRSARIPFEIRKVGTIGLDTEGIQEYNLLGDTRGAWHWQSEREDPTLPRPTPTRRFHAYYPLKIFCFSARWTAEAGAQYAAQPRRKWSKLGQTGQRPNTPGARTN